MRAPLVHLHEDRAIAVDRKRDLVAAAELQGFAHRRGQYYHEGVPTLAQPTKEDHTSLAYTVPPGGGKGDKNCQKKRRIQWCNTYSDW